jgi:hypothetical protein
MEWAFKRKPGEYRLHPERVPSWKSSCSSSLTRPALSRETDGNYIVAEETEGNSRFGFDRVTIEFVGTISPTPHGFGGGPGERTIPTQNIDFSYGAILTYHRLQTDFPSQGSIPRNRILDTARRRLGNPQTFRRSGSRGRSS